MPSKLNQFIVLLRVSSLLYGLIALGSAALLLLFPLLKISPSSEDGIVLILMAILMSIMSVGIIIFNEVVINSLKKGRFWAWIAGVCISGLYIPSIFLPLGIFMLLALIDDEMRGFCAKKPKAPISID